MKILRKVPLTTLILGLLIVAYSLVSYFVDKGFFSLSSKVGQIVIGVGLITFAILVIWPKVAKKTNAGSTALRSTEFVIVIIAAVLGFLLPVFGVNTISLGSGSLWFGLTLVMYGSVELYLTNNKRGTFFASLGAVILGTYIYATNFIEGNLKISTLILMLGAGAFLTIVGLVSLKKPTK